MEEVRIQISGAQGRTARYEAAVRRAGGQPVVGFCPRPDLTCGGLLLCGGGDLAPAWYGAADRGSGPPDLDRDRSELALVRAYLSAGRPILGICRGLQVLNVALGGTLIWGMRCAPSIRGSATCGIPFVPPRAACSTGCGAAAS